MRTAGGADRPRFWRHSSSGSDGRTALSNSRGWLRWGWWLMMS